MIIPQAAITGIPSLDSVRDMGWWNLLWLILIAFLVLAAKAKKIGVTSIGKNEWGMMEILGFPLIPVPFGFWPFVKGVFHVKQVSTAPTRIDITNRREINGRVLLVDISIWVVVGTKGIGSLSQRFLQRRRDLIAAIYNALDENVDDAENPERIAQTRDILEATTRNILKDAEGTDEVTLEALITRCGEILQANLGEYLKKVFIREDAPVDGQLWKEGRSNDPVQDSELPPSTLPELRSVPGELA